MSLGNGYAVMEVIDAAKAITGCDIKVKIQPRRPGDPPVLIGSSEKAKKLLNWNPKYSDINDIIGHAWNWYCNPNKY